MPPTATFLASRTRPPDATREPLLLRQHQRQEQEQMQMQFEPPKRQQNGQRAVEAYAAPSLARRALLALPALLAVRGRDRDRDRARLLARSVPVGHPQARHYFVAQQTTAAAVPAAAVQAQAAAPRKGEWKPADVLELPPHGQLDLSAAGVLPADVAVCARRARWRAVLVVDYRRILVLVLHDASIAENAETATTATMEQEVTEDDVGEAARSMRDALLPMRPTVASSSVLPELAFYDIPSALPPSAASVTKLRSSAAIDCPSDTASNHEMTRASRRALFGDNEIVFPVQSRLALLFDELTHPFFIFQLLAVALWVLEHYIMYAFAILVTSLGGAWLQAHEIHANAQRLSDLAAVRSSHQGSPDAHDARLRHEAIVRLVPGDVVEVHIGDIVPADCTLIEGAALVNEASLTGESAPVRKSAWLPSRRETPWDASEVTMFAGTRVLTARTGSRAVVTRTACSTQRGELVRDILLRPDEVGGWGGAAASTSSPKSSAYNPKRLVPPDVSHDRASLDGPVLHESTSVSATDNQGVSREIYGTLLFLLILGVLGAVWSTQRFVRVFKLAWGDAIIESLDLITISVPPALPATVTFGLAFAIGRLQAHRILCVRAAAVPRAGHAQVLCFDKTGTLTESGLDVHSVYSTAASRQSEAARTRNEPPSLLTCVLREQDTVLLGGSSHAFHQHLEAPRIQSMPSEICCALACCHALSFVNGKLVGDVVDLRLFQLSKFELMDGDEDSMQYSSSGAFPGQASITNGLEQRPASSRDNVVFRVRGDGHDIAIVRLLDFRSDLARQGTVAVPEDSGETSRLFVFVKGAPEVIARLSLPESVPNNLRDILNDHTSHGRRVLALASRTLQCERDGDLVNAAMSVPRSELEQNLTFLGLVVLENRLKLDTHTVISEISTNSSLQTRLVTGDHAKTAVSVARQCGILPAGPGVLQIRIVNSAEMVPDVLKSVVDEPLETCFEFFDPEDQSHSSRSYSVDEIFLYFKGSQHGEHGKPKFSLVVTGPVFDAVQSNEKLLDFVLRYGVVFSRMSPVQKTYLIRALKAHLGHNVLMCGDGANDVGALREADTGVALAASDEQVYADDLEEVVVNSNVSYPADERLQDPSTSASEYGVEYHGRGRVEESPPVPALPEVQEAQQAASLAASFTSHGSSIRGTLEVIRQGRAAAAASLAAFQFMFLYSIIQFSSVMLLYSCGALVADGQFLFVDLFLVMPLAVLMSRLDAARQLHDKVPPGSIRELSVAVPTTLLAAVQVAFQCFVFFFVLPGVPETESRLANGSGTLITECALVTGMFVFVNLQYVFTAVALNLGAPHRCALRKNRMAFVGAIVAMCVCIQLLSFPGSWQTWWLEMVPLDGSVRRVLGLLNLLNFACTIGVVKLSAFRER